MNPFVSSVIQGLAVLTIIADILIVLFLIFLAFSYFRPNYKPIKKAKLFITENSIAFSLVITAIATLGSLFLSEVAKFTPCNLCWYQRIFMYPLPIFFGISLFTDDKNIKKYVLPLAVVGFLIAAYHYNLQMFPELLPCTDEVANCSLKQITHFGYITIPTMSASAFLLVILLNTFSFWEKRKPR